MYFFQRCYLDEVEGWFPLFLPVGGISLLELQSFDKWAKPLWCKTFVLIFICSFLLIYMEKLLTLLIKSLSTFNEWIQGNVNFILDLPEMVDGILPFQGRMEKDAADFTKGSKMSSFLRMERILLFSWKNRFFKIEWTI